MKPGKFAKPFRIANGSKFRLKDFDPGETLGLKSKEHASEILDHGISRLADLQEKLHAHDKWGLLFILQGMDAAGKDSVIKHVMSGVNPLGCRVTSFKAPSSDDLQHDFLWRTTAALPSRGTIGIFNRSYYEEVLIVRVHSKVLGQEKLPAQLISKKLWKERFEDINTHERYLSRNGFVVRKFFLNISKKEQKKRFLKRLDEPEKNWKFSATDVLERQYWNRYMDAYEDMVRNTSTELAPWYVVPANHKWFTHVVVAEAIIDTLEEFNFSFPKIDAQRRGDLNRARQALKSEKDTLNKSR